MLSGLGKIHVDQKAQRIVVNLSRDFIPYYLWFIKKEYWIDLQAPMHYGHITLANKKLYTGVDYQQAADSYHGQIVDFMYDVNAVRGGYTKGFVMFYLKVYSEELDDIKRKLNIVDRYDYRGLHITLGNSKAGLRTYWPEMIEIKK
jgi:hypothetical protein